MPDITPRTIEDVTIEIIAYKNNTARNIIEIGKRLIEAKEMLPHGEWGKWLEEKVEFSQNTAGQFMRVAKEMSNSETFKNLGTGKVFALLTLPAEKRETFVKENPVDEMTTRQLEAAIKEKKEAERRAKEAEEKATEAAERENDLIDEVNRLNKQIGKTQKPEVIEKVIETVPESIQQEIVSLQKDKARLQEENRTLKITMEAQKTSDQLKSEMEGKVSTFTGRIRGFLRDMSSLGYVGPEVFRTSQYAQKEYADALSALEKWCSDIRQKLQDTNMIIDVKED